MGDKIKVTVNGKDTYVTPDELNKLANEHAHIDRIETNGAIQRNVRR